MIKFKYNAGDYVWIFIDNSFIETRVLECQEILNQPFYLLQTYQWGPMSFAEKRIFGTKDACLQALPTLIRFRPYEK